ncbi:MAG TPA: hypothetical protein DDZ51_22370 [Planctomycetaceae bacterium]|nr:hypothetical protein [Planctomycetaceae bacterium]
MASTWTDLWTAPTVQAVAGLLVLCILIAVAFNLVSRFRDYAAEDGRDQESVLPNFQEMLRRGEITAAEYRKIQTRSDGVSVVEQTQRSVFQTDEPEGAG